KSWRLTPCPSRNFRRKMRNSSYLQSAVSRKTAARRKRLLLCRGIALGRIFTWFLLSVDTSTQAKSSLYSAREPPQERHNKERTDLNCDASTQNQEVETPGNSQTTKPTR
ncbi:unnamed protein product, partial [Amoebophrya sp. A120]